MWLKLVQLCSKTKNHQMILEELFDKSKTFNEIKNVNKKTFYRIINSYLINGIAEKNENKYSLTVKGKLLALVVLGKLLEAIAKNRTNDAIKKLMNLAPKTATIFREGKEIVVPVDSVIIGDIILVRPGERLAVDGEIVEGYSSVDESMITGESIPLEKKSGDIVIGGTMNKLGTFKFKATKIGENTTLSHIIRLIDEAQGKKAPIQRYADKISAYFVPAVIAIAIVTFSAWYFVFNAGLAFSLHVNRMIALGQSRNINKSAVAIFIKDVFCARTIRIFSLLGLR